MSQFLQQPRRAYRGVTLIELLVAMSVAGLVLIAVLGIFSFSTRQLRTQTGRATTVMFANQAMNAMCKEIGNAGGTGVDKQGNLYFIMPGNTDAQGNFIPALVGGVIGYTYGNYVEFYRSNQNGKANNGTILWRQTLAPDLKGTPDSAWSLLPGGKPALPKYPNTTALTFDTSGAPNTVKITLTMADKEGGVTSSYTTSRLVYLSNHN